MFFAIWYRGFLSLVSLVPSTLMEIHARAARFLHVFSFLICCKHWCPSQPHYGCRKVKLGKKKKKKTNPATCWWCCKYSDWIVCHPQGPIMVHHFVGWSSRGRSSAPKKLSCSPGSPRWVLSYCWALRGWSDLPIATSYKMLQAFNWRCCTWCLGCPMTPRSVVVGSPSKGQSWTRANCSMSSQGATVITETS